ncbi:MAG: hypothetical protein J6A20_00310 [Muribaculaceae bacterium]|nr:hypothetical protein [Muribaculaceae bacterium]
MKKKILGLALVAMSFVTVNSIAQTPNQNNTCHVNKENAICKKGNANGVCNQKQVCPFDGLNLSDAQKDQMKQLKAKRDAARAEMKKADKADKQRRDSAKMADRRNAKKEYLEEIKVILTPEQYTMFLENFYINGGNHHAKAFKNGKDMKFKGDRKGKPGKDGKRKHAHRGAKNMNTSAPAANS